MEAFLFSLDFLFVFLLLKAIKHSIFNPSDQNLGIFSYKESFQGEIVRDQKSKKAVFNA
jgi:hypothetical protein